MSVHRIIDEIEIPVPIEVAWEFFSNPNNLQKLTPANVNFQHVFSPEADEVYPGMLLVYKISPVAKVPITWVTEISHVEKFKRFVDDQLRGPFGMWHHIHEFESRGASTLVRDVLYYKMPLGFLGSFAHMLFAKKQVQDIFRYRKENLQKLFSD